MSPGRRHGVRRQPRVRAGAARLPELGPRVINPAKPGPGLPVLGEPQLGERRQVPARPDPVGRPVVHADGQRRVGQEAADLVQDQGGQGRRGRGVAGVLAAHLRRLRHRAGQADRGGQGRRPETSATDRYAMTRRPTPRRGERSALGPGLAVLGAVLALVAFLSVTHGLARRSAWPRCCARWAASAATARSTSTVTLELRVPAHAARHPGRARRSASPAPSCRASPATRSPTPGSWASTPGAAAFVVFAITVLGVARRRRLRVVRVRRRGRARLVAGLRDRLARPGGRDAGQAGAGRRGRHRRPRLGHHRHRDDQRRRPQRAAVLAGRLARRPVRADPDRGGAVPDRSAWSRRSRFGRALNGLALGEDVARGLGQRVGRTRRPRSPSSPCSRARPPRRAGRSSSSGWSCRTSPGSSAGPTTAGSCRTRCCWRRSCCCSPTCSAGWLAAPGELQVGVVLGVLGAPVFVAHRPLRAAVGGVSDDRDRSTSHDRRHRRDALRATRRRRRARAVVVTGALAAVVVALFVLTMMVGSFRLSAVRGRRLGAAPARRPERRLRRARPAAADRDVRAGRRPRARRLRDDLPAAAAQPARLAGLRRRHLRRRASPRSAAIVLLQVGGLAVSGLALGGAARRRAR